MCVVRCGVWLCSVCMEVCGVDGERDGNVPKLK